MLFVVDSWQARVELHDLVSMDDSQVQGLLQASPRVDCALVQQSPDAIVAKKTAAGDYQRALLVVPASVDIQRIVPPAANYSVVQLYSYFPHVNFDHIGEVLQQPLARAQLGVFAVCSQE
ncbi:hypothetical protein IWW54_003299 [Coemansia sp. RSA 2705]|nr:hypothetical protein IWW54_003299 [Coemansia sp. RSA 2705]